MSNSRSPRAVRSITMGISGMACNPSGRGERDRERAPRPRRRARRTAALALVAAMAVAGSAAAMTSHAGWPRDEHLVMDKGPAGREHVLVGLRHRHNYLLGGSGNDTVYGGENGDVL